MFSVNSKRLTLVLFSTVAGIITLTALQSGKIVSQTPEVIEKASSRDKAAVRFKSPTKLKEALSEVRSQGISVDYIQREYKVGNQTYTGFLFVNDKLDATAITNEYWKFYSSAIENKLKDPGPPASNLSSEEQPVPNQTLEEEDPKGKEARLLHRKLFEEQREKFKPYKGCWKNNTCPEVFITEMQLSGDTTKLLKLKASPKFARVNIRSEIRRIAPPNQPPASSKSLLKTPVPSSRLQPGNSLLTLDKTMVPQLYAQYYEYDYRYARNTNANTWAPTNGSFNTGFYDRDQYNNENRYIYNEFYWAGAERLTEFNERSAYEHDFFLNNSTDSTLGPGTYLTEAQTLNGFPDVWYAESNLPEPYLDTAITDDNAIRAFTIGSAEAAQIAPWIMYHTYIIGRRGSANQDNAYLSVQLGIQDPPYCTNTWCVYSVDQRLLRSTRNFSGFPWWIPVPHSNVPWTKTMW